MAGLSDLLGANGVIEQLLLWNVAGQVVTALASPAFTALQQDMQARNPELVITPSDAPNRLNPVSTRHGSPSCAKWPRSG